MAAEGSRDGARGGLWRSRWAAIGAAIAVTFGAGGLVAVNAAGGAESSTVLIDPVRVLDSRDPVDVGLAGPFSSQASQKLQVTGSIATTTGTKTVVPTGATGVLLNVTAVGATARGFVSIRPGDATGAPSTSSLNFEAGDVVPNAVSVALPTGGGDAGRIDITYDAYGASGPTTDILIDVVGYTTATAGAPAQPAAGGTVGESAELADGETAEVVSIQVTAPVAGTVVVDASSAVSDMFPGGKVFCSITTGSGLEAPSQAWESAGPDGSIGQLAASRAFPIAAGTHTFRWICESATSDNGELAFVTSPTMTYVFVPS